MRFLQDVLVYTLGIVFGVLLFFKVTKSPIYMEKEFEGIYVQFVEDAEYYKTPIDFSMNVTMFTKELDLGTAAFCTVNKVVVVSREVWDDLTPESKKALLYHEWGHCILKRDHVSVLTETPACPLSLMYPSIDYVDKCFTKSYDWYIMELFRNPGNFPSIKL